MEKVPRFLFDIKHFLNINKLGYSVLPKFPLWRKYSHCGDISFDDSKVDRFPCCTVEMRFWLWYYLRQRVCNLLAAAGLRWNFPRLRIVVFHSANRTRLRNGRRPLTTARNTCNRKTRARLSVRGLGWKNASRTRELFIVANKIQKRTPPEYSCQFFFDKLNARRSGLCFIVFYVRDK